MDRVWHRRVSLGYTTPNKSGVVFAKAMTDSINEPNLSSNMADSREGEGGGSLFEVVVADLHNKRYPAPDR